MAACRRHFHALELTCLHVGGSSRLTRLSSSTQFSISSDPVDKSAHHTCIVVNAPGMNTRTCPTAFGSL